jgi:hypothetical protein
MLCNATMSFIAIAIAYFIVSIAGYNNLPNAYFLFGSVFMTFLIQLACSFMGELFGWMTMVLLGLAIYLYFLFGAKEREVDPPNNNGVCTCCMRRNCRGCCYRNSNPSPSCPEPAPKPAPTTGSKNNC